MTTEVKITNVNGPKAVRIFIAGVAHVDLQPGESQSCYLYGSMTLAEADPTAATVQPMGAGGPGEPRPK